jgi:hypothetical protein
LDREVRLFFERWHTGAFSVDVASWARRQGFAADAGESWSGPCPWNANSRITLHAATGCWRMLPDGEAGRFFDLLGRTEGLPSLQAALRYAGQGTSEPLEPLRDCPELAYDHAALRARGLEQANCQERRIGVVCEAGHPKQGWMGVTVFDILGRPAGITYRRLSDAPKPSRAPRWSVERAFPRGRHLYNLDRAWPSVAALRTAILVEGPFDAIHVERGGWTNAVALLGNRLTGWHVDLLLTVGAERVVLLLDNDHGGREGRRWALRGDGRLDQFKVFDLSGKLPPGHDPDEVPHQVLASFLESFRPRYGPFE